MKKICALMLCFASLLNANAPDESPPDEEFHQIGGFIAGTIVHLENGQDTIQNIRVNDRVASYDGKTGEVVYKRVIQTYRVKTDSLVHLVIGGKSLYANPDHRFYVVEDEKLWVRAGDLDPAKHTLTNRKGQEVKIEFAEIIDGNETVYDFTVEDTENYFIGDGEILVHNWFFFIPILSWSFGSGVALGGSILYLGYSFATMAALAVMGYFNTLPPLGGLSTGSLFQNTKRGWELKNLGEDLFNNNIHHPRGASRFGPFASPRGPDTFNPEPMMSNTNPYAGPVDERVFAVDPYGNAIPVNPGERLTGNFKGKDPGSYQQARGPDGEETGVRMDRGGHKGHKDPVSKEPHAHRPDHPNLPDHLPIKGQ